MLKFINHLFLEMIVKKNQKNDQFKSIWKKSKFHRFSHSDFFTKKIAIVVGGLKKNVRRRTRAKIFRLFAEIFFKSIFESIYEKISTLMINFKLFNSSKSFHNELNNYTEHKQGKSMQTYIYNLAFFMHISAVFRLLKFHSTIIFDFQDPNIILRWSQPNMVVLYLKIWMNLEILCSGVQLTEVKVILSDTFSAKMKKEMRRAIFKQN